MEAAFRLEVGRTCLWFNYEVKNWNSQPQSEAHKKKNIDKSWKWHKIGNGEENCSNNSWVITSICCTFALSLSLHTHSLPCYVNDREIRCVWKSFTRCSNFCCYHIPLLLCVSLEKALFMSICTCDCQKEIFYEVWRESLD